MNGPIRRMREALRIAKANEQQTVVIFAKDLSELVAAYERDHPEHGSQMAEFDEQLHKARLTAAGLIG